jgi:hypothetical protein
MIRQLQSERSPALAQEVRGMDRQPAVTHRLDRLVQVALALYLIPALLIVLVVGGIGMLVLAVVRLLTWVMSGPASWSRTLVGPQDRHVPPTTSSSRPK